MCFSGPVPINDCADESGVLPQEGEKGKSESITLQKFISDREKPIQRGLLTPEKGLYEIQNFYIKNFIKKRNLELL